MSYKVTLSNGRVLDGLGLSGSTFLTGEKVSREDFAGGLRPVKIEGPEPEEGAEDLRGTYENLKLAAVVKVGPKWGFGFEEAVTPEPESVTALRADVDYLLMMMEGNDEQ